MDIVYNRLLSLDELGNLSVFSTYPVKFTVVEKHSKQFTDVIA